MLGWRSSLGGGNEEAVPRKEQKGTASLQHKGPQVSFNGHKVPCGQDGSRNRTLGVHAPVAGLGRGRVYKGWRFKV